MPHEVDRFEPDASAVFAQFKNGDSERMIHQRVDLRDVEQTQLCLLRAEAELQDQAFFPSIALAATRFLMDAHGDHKLALKKMQRAQEWRLNFSSAGPLTSQEVGELLRLGIVYFCGRDRMLRPTLVVRLGRLPAERLAVEGGIEAAAKVVVFCMEYFQKYMAVPGKVESFSIILDIKGVSFGIAKPSIISTLIAALSHQSPGVIFRFYVVNMSMMLRAISGIVQGFLTERQRGKIVFAGHVKDFQGEFAPHQLEVDLGGTRPIVNDFWPFPLAPGPFNGASDEKHGTHTALPTLLLHAGRSHASVDTGGDSSEACLVELPGNLKPNGDNQPERKALSSPLSIFSWVARRALEVQIRPAFSWKLFPRRTIVLLLLVLVCNSRSSFRLKLIKQFAFGFFK
jgi:hypothetical protein